MKTKKQTKICLWAYGYLGLVLDKLGNDIVGACASYFSENNLSARKQNKIIFLAAKLLSPTVVINTQQKYLR